MVGNLESTGNLWDAVLQIYSLLHVYVFPDKKNCFIDCQIVGLSLLWIQAKLCKLAEVNMCDCE